MIHYPAYKVAAAHLAPVFLDTDRSVDKACSVIEEAAGHGARLIAFPEVFLPGFPVWAGIEAPIRTHELFKKLAASAVSINGPELARIRQTARQKGIFVSIGFTEGTKTSVGCLWNSNALIGASSAAQTGNPDRNTSGKAIRRAPCLAASTMAEQAFSTLRSVSRNTGAKWAAATL